DFLMDLRNLERAKDDLEFRGVKGTTGTQASFLAIFDGDHYKVEQLDDYVTKRAGFQTTCDIACQTYSRHVDLDTSNSFSSFGATCQKICGDIRRLASFREMEEPFGKDQIGSSAMAYKRNPMLSERCTSLARYLANLNKNAADTYASQWLERSLDDSAIRRLYIPEMFLCADSILIILDNIFSGLVVYPAMIKRRLTDELPFMATENIIMALVAKGISRQEAHEKIRVHSHAAAYEIKAMGKDNNLIELVKGDPFFEPILEELPKLLEPQSFVGRAPQQVEKFLSGPVKMALEPYKALLNNGAVAEIHV
ncbi:MAG: adenylosuccinase ade13, partial [Pleopsidium flavum]